MPTPKSSLSLPPPTLSNPSLPCFAITHWIQLVLTAGNLTDFVGLVIPRSCAGDCSCFYEYNSNVMSKGQHLPHSSRPSSSSIYQPSLPSLSIGGGVDTDSHLGLSVHSHFFSALWPAVSLCTDCHFCKRRLLWPKLRAAQTCGYKHKPLEGAWQNDHLVK